jgi:toxin ParE1/3/4
VRYRIIYHDKADAELDELYEQIALRAGPVIAGNYVRGIYDFVDGLTTFPERGTVREGNIPGLRIIGYRRSVSVAFVVKGNDVMILGVFHRGQNITLEELEERW